MKHRGLLLIIISVLIIICSSLLVFPKAFSLYEYNANSNTAISYAFYLLETNYYTTEIKLGEMLPSNNEYTYNFSVSNFEGSNRTDVDMEYDLSIVTTTNLPLTYELYIDEVHTDSGATDAIISRNIAADTYGTYFNTMTTPTKYFSYTENKTYNYELVVHFPATYNASEYQGIIESIAVHITSRQVTE